MANTPEFDPYTYLAQRRYPKAFMIRDLLPDDLTGQRQREHYRAQATAFMKELRAKPPEELNALLLEERNKEAEEKAERIRQEEASRFFNRSSARADFAHWSKAAYWTLEEAVALVFGKEPRRVNAKSLQPLLEISPFAGAYRDLHDLALRAKAMGQLYDPVLPGFFLGWTRRMKVTVDPHLIEHITANGVLIADWKILLDEEKKAHELTAAALAEQKERADTLAEQLRNAPILPRGNEMPKDQRPLGTRERSSLLKLFIGMAIKGYSYQPDALKNGAVPDICSDLAELGISLSEDTVRKFLKEAAELLPRDKAE